MKILQIAAVSLCSLALLGASSIVEARPPGPPHGHRGFRHPAPPPPPPRAHHHHRKGHSVGDALAVGVGIGLAGAVANALLPKGPAVVPPAPAPMYVPPAYVTPGYAPPPGSVVVMPPARYY